MSNLYDVEIKQVETYFLEGIRATSRENAADIAIHMFDKDNERYHQDSDATTKVVGTRSDKEES